MGLAAGAWRSGRGCPGAGRCPALREGWVWGLTALGGHSSSVSLALGFEAKQFPLHLGVFICQRRWQKLEVAPE